MKNTKKTLTKTTKAPKKATLQAKVKKGLTPDKAKRR